MLFGLYTISGGIRLDGELPAHPLTNTIFLAVGAVLASLAGTTGAAMLLIRPLLESNRQRTHVAHTVVFFIFIVCNTGGCLLPTGDPPLFLGYLLGVRFLWTLTLWPEWLFVNGSLLLLYYLIDRFWYYAREPAAAIARDETRVHRLRIRGLWPNALLLAATVLAVALLDPGKALPGTTWHPWFYLREMAVLMLIATSLLLSHHKRAARKPVRLRGHGGSGRPLLRHFHLHAAGAGNPRGQGAGVGAHARRRASSGPPAAFPPYWTTRPLMSSSSPRPKPWAAALRPRPAWRRPTLAAISLGAVFMGAMTYIGNGPNFMARAIAQRTGVPMPGFFGYMVYSCLILLPLLAITVLVVREVEPMHAAAPPCKNPCNPV